MKTNFNMVSSDVFENVSSNGYDERVNRRRRGNSSMMNSYSIINPNNFIYVMPKNSCKIGMINKKMYVVCLRRVEEVDGRELKSREEMVVHTLKTRDDEIIERYENDLAIGYFMKMLFF